MAASLITQAIQLFVIDKITGGFLSFAKGLTGKAIGGSVQSGQPYMVGERGPEMFVPNQSGSIVPNKKMGGGVTVINNVDARGSGADVDQKIKSAMAQTSQQTIMTIQDLMRRRRFV
jgi:phage-related minor tail protein